MVSSSGFKYMLTCMDAFTKYSLVFLLKQKSEVYYVFTTFVLAFNTQFNSKVKVVQIDGGGEFQHLTNFLDQQSTIHRLTCPDTHHQNG